MCGTQGAVPAGTRLPANVMSRVHEAMRQSAVAAAESRQQHRTATASSGTQQRHASATANTDEAPSHHQNKVTRLTVIHIDQLSVVC